MKVANEARVGVVVVIALVLLVTGYFYLRGLGLSSDKYYMRLLGAASVAPGNDVRLQGVKIGQVLDVALNDEQKPIITVAVKRGKSPVQLLKSYKSAVQTSAGTLDWAGRPDNGWVDQPRPYRCSTGPSPSCVRSVTALAKPSR